MAYDEALASRIRRLLEGQEGSSERKMFGGIAFMVAGNMCCGVVKSQLMVRVGPDAYESALGEPHAQPMDFTGRPMKGMVYVSSDGLADSVSLQKWVDRGLSHARSLPRKGG